MSNNDGASREIDNINELQCMRGRASNLHWYQSELQFHQTRKTATEFCLTVCRGIVLSALSPKPQPFHIGMISSWFLDFYENKNKFRQILRILWQFKFGKMALFVAHFRVSRSLKQVNFSQSQALCGCKIRRVRPSKLNWKRHKNRTICLN